MKQKKHSIPYWLKSHYTYTGVDEVVLDAIRTFAENGSHPEIDFDGQLIDFTNALYIEWKRRGKVYDGLYPTPFDVTSQAFKLLENDGFVGKTILDPGCGLGNISYVAQYSYGYNTISIDFSNLACEVSRLVGIKNVIKGDFVGNEYNKPCDVGAFDAVVVNPPFGRIFGRKQDIAIDFMDRIAELSTSGTLVSAILPNGFMCKDRPRAHVQMQERYKILYEEQVRKDAFVPLTSVSTILYLLEVINGGRNNENISCFAPTNDNYVKTEEQAVNELCCCDAQQLTMFWKG